MTTNLAYRMWLRGARKRLLDPDERVKIIALRDAPTTKADSRGMLDYALTETQAEYDAKIKDAN